MSDPTKPETSEAVERLARHVAEIMEEDGGCWSPCSGCQESCDGCVSTKDYPYSAIFQCQPGGGCRECGGIGVLWQDGAFLASYGEVLSTPPAGQNVERAFAIGDRVEKVKGSAWHGRVVGFYSTDLTPVGYAVESEREPGSVQIYPEAALCAAAPSVAIPADDAGVRAGWKLVPVEPTEAMIEEMSIIAQACLSATGKVDVALIYGTGIQAAPVQCIPSREAVYDKVRDLISEMQMGDASEYETTDAIVAMLAASPKAPVAIGAGEAITAAIKQADDAFGYSYRLTKLDDSGEEHTLFMDGHEPAVFADREDGYLVIEQRRNANRAARILAALTPASASIPADVEREALAWLASNPRLTLESFGPVYGDDDDQSKGWRVMRESGPINDREWDEIGRGDTPLAALLAARPSTPQANDGTSIPDGEEG